MSGAGGTRAHPPVLTRIGLAGLIVLCALGAAGNLLRVACWTQAEGFILAPFSTTAIPLARSPTVVTSYARVEIPAPAWRPMLVELRVRARASGATGGGAASARPGEDAGRDGVNAGAAASGGSHHTGAAGIDVALDGDAQGIRPVSGEWQALTLTAARPAVTPGRLTLSVSALPAGRPAASGSVPQGSAPLGSDQTAPPGSAAPGSDQPGSDRAGLQAGRPSQAGQSQGVVVDLEAVKLAPVFATWPLLRHAATGALVGLLLWGLIVWRGMSAADAMTSGRASGAVRAGWRAEVRVGVAVFLLLTGWALVRPPNQTPDEPHHFIRVTSILQGPWVAGADHVRFDRRFLNPMTWAMPPLARIAFHPDERLSPEDVDFLKGTDWRRVEAIGADGSLHAAIVSYPPLYYLGVFFIAQPIVSLAHLTPYQAFYVYRLASILLTTLAWVAVYALLRRTAEIGPYAGAMLAVIILNPMLAFMSSGVNADALSVPLIALAVVAAWRTLSTGAQPWVTFAAALAALLTKPSGAQMVAAVAVAMVWSVWRGRAVGGTGTGGGTGSGASWARAWLAGRAAALAVVIAYVTFYAWSPTHFYPEPGHEGIGLAEYVTHVLGATGDVWMSFWGVLGWLEYRLPAAWYASLLALVLLCAWWRWRARADTRPTSHSSSDWDRYVMVYALVFLASTLVGGFINLSVAGYMLQGRYFLPMAIALSPLVMQERRWQRWLLPAFVGLLNLLLIRATVWRYYGSDWSLLWRSLPF